MLGQRRRATLIVIVIVMAATAAPWGFGSTTPFASAAITFRSHGGDAAVNVWATSGYCGRHLKLRTAGSMSS